jgi:hypothetical protein
MRNYWTIVELGQYCYGTVVVILNYEGKVRLIWWIYLYVGVHIQMMIYYNVYTKEKEIYFLDVPLTLAERV